MFPKSAIRRVSIGKKWIFFCYTFCKIGFYELESRLNLDSEYAAELRFDSDSKAQEKWEKWEKRKI